MEKAGLFCLVPSRHSEAVTQSGSVMLDLGVLKVLLQVGLVPVVGGMVSEWERGCWGKIHCLEFGCAGQERSWIFCIALCD